MEMSEFVVTICRDCEEVLSAIQDRMKHRAERHETEMLVVKRRVRSAPHGQKDEQWATAWKRR